MPRRSLAACGIGSDEGRMNLIKLEERIADSEARAALAQEGER